MPDPTREERIAEALGEWHRRRELDPSLDPAAFLAEQGDLADSLAEHLATERMLGLAGLAPVEPRTPRVLGDFRIVREIGRGGMGIVYEAEQVSMRRIVALKVLHPAVTLHPHAIERFRREAQAAGRLHHTHIVPVFAMGEADGCWWYAMELVKGRTLADICADLRRLGAGSSRATPAPATSALGSSSGGREFYVRVARAFAGVAEGLHGAHLANVVHRDVKPSNLILDDDGTLKLTDFGLARMEGELPTVTLTGAVLGTPAYMSPEQVLGAGRVDARTDVYSLGASLYELLTLRPPFRGATDDVLAKIVRGSPPSPRAFERRVPRDLETIVMKALEREPGRRYATAADLARDLTHFAQGLGIQARRASLVTRLWRGARRHRRALLTAGALLLACGVTAAALHSASRSDEARARLAYDEALRRSASRLLVQGSFGGGLLQRLSLESSADVGPLLAEARDARPADPAPALLAALLPETPGPARLAALDAGRERGLDEAAWRWGRAYVLRRTGSATEAEREAAIAAKLVSAEPWTTLLAAYVRLDAGDRAGAVSLLTVLLDEPLAPSGHLARPFAQYARGFAREQLGDPNRALEDYAAVEPLFVFSWPHLRMRMATAWWKLGRREEAQRCFDEALATVRQTPSENATPHAQIADACSGWGLPWEWRDLATRAMVEDKPQDPQTWLQRAECLWAQPQPDLAQVVELKQKALSLASDPALKRLILIALGRTLIVQERHAEALSMAEQASALDAGSAEAAMLRATALVGLGQKDEAGRIAREAIERDPSHATLHQGALVFRWLEAHEEALRVLDRSIQVAPDCLNCRRIRIDILWRSKRWADLGRAARDLLTIDPADLEGWKRLSEASAQLERWEEYLESAQALTRLVPGDFRWWANLADALLRLGKPADALPVVRHAQGLGMTTRNGYRLAADCLSQLGRVDEAAAELRKAVEAGVADDILYDEGVNMLRRAGRHEEAVAFAREGLERFPRSATIRSELASTLLALGRTAEALPVAEQVRDLEPSNNFAWANVAIIQKRLGMDEAALATAREGVARADGAVVRFTLGRLLLVAGKVAEAHEVWKPLVDAEPAGPHVLEQHVRAVWACGSPKQAALLAQRMRDRWGLQEGTRTASELVGMAQLDAASRPDAQEFVQAVASQAATWPDLTGSDGAYLLVAAGRAADAATLAARLPAPTSPAEAYSRAHMYAAMGRKRDALDLLAQAHLLGYRSPMAGGEPGFVGLKGDAQAEEAFAKLR